MGGIPDLRRLGIDIRLEYLARRVVERLRYYDKMGLSLNTVLDRVSKEFGTTIAWLNLKRMTTVGQWYVINLLAKKPELLKSFILKNLVYVWRK